MTLGGRGALFEVLGMADSEGDTGGPNSDRQNSVCVCDPPSASPSLTQPYSGQSEAETPCLQWVADEGGRGNHPCPLSWDPGLFFLKIYHVGSFLLVES